MQNARTRIMNQPSLNFSVRIVGIRAPRFEHVGEQRRGDRGRERWLRVANNTDKHNSEFDNIFQATMTAGRVVRGSSNTPNSATNPV